MNCMSTAAIWLVRRAYALLFLCALASPPTLFAQGVTTGSLGGIVKDAQEKPVAGATVIALHVPSGTTYEAVTRADGRYSIPGMRVGGPYTVTVAKGPTAAPAFRAADAGEVVVNLGVGDGSRLRRAVDSRGSDGARRSRTRFSSERTGAATAISRETLARCRRSRAGSNDITRLTPQSGGTMSFAGQDNRLNNITVDGSYFNNSFGLRNTPGETSGVAPISLAAIEQVQVSVAPFDVRQGNFVGAAVNTVTRSGTNEFRGSFYHQFRDNDLVGTKAKAATVNPGTFNFRNTGGWASGPIVTNSCSSSATTRTKRRHSRARRSARTRVGKPVGGQRDARARVGPRCPEQLPGTTSTTTPGPIRNTTTRRRRSGPGQGRLQPERQQQAESFRYNQLDSSTDMLAVELVLARLRQPPHQH